MQSQYSRQFEQLTSLLTANAPLWRCEPFKETPAWAIEQSPITAALKRLDLDTVRAAQASDLALLDALQACLPDQCRSIAALCALPHLDAAASDKEPAHIPGRKWQQISRFGAALQHCRQPVLEWCAGKAHLGRWLNSHYGCQVTALELESALVSKGNTLNRPTENPEMPAPVCIEQCDVLNDNTQAHLSRTRHAVALHACGGLHRKLLTDATQVITARISWSPCCYHKYLGNTYEPLSRAGKASKLSLSLAELRTAVRQNSTAGRAEKQRHEKLQAWRLGFDQLQRELSGCDHYLAVPSVPTQLAHGSFAEFCRHVAAIKNIALDNSTDFNACEQAGKRRYSEVSRQELVRELFRRPLELWLVLDEILFLEEHDYCCELTTFCTADITPRNLFINATKK